MDDGRIDNGCGGFFDVKLFSVSRRFINSSSRIKVSSCAGRLRKRQRVLWSVMRKSLKRQKSWKSMRVMRLYSGSERLCHWPGRMALNGGKRIGGTAAVVAQVAGFAAGEVLPDECSVKNTVGVGEGEAVETFFDVIEGVGV